MFYVQEEREKMVDWNIQERPRLSYADFKAKTIVSPKHTTHKIASRVQIDKAVIEYKRYGCTIEALSLVLAVNQLDQAYAKNIIALSREDGVNHDWIDYLYLYPFDIVEAHIDEWLEAKANVVNVTIELLERAKDFNSFSAVASQLSVRNLIDVKLYGSFNRPESRYYLLKEIYNRVAIDIESRPASPLFSMIPQDTMTKLSEYVKNVNSDPEGMEISAESVSAAVAEYLHLRELKKSNRKVKLKPKDPEAHERDIKYRTIKALQLSVLSELPIVTSLSDKIEYAVKELLKAKADRELKITAKREIVRQVITTVRSGTYIPIINVLNGLYTSDQSPDVVRFIENVLSEIENNIIKNIKVFGSLNSYAQTLDYSNREFLMKYVRKDWQGERK